jgi:two-component system response regulator AtoC
MPNQVELRRVEQFPQSPPPIEIAIKQDNYSLDELEKDAIIQALQKTNQNQSHAARLLKISRDTLRYRMKKHGLS